MLKARLLIRLCGERSPLIIMVLALLLTTALPKVASSEGNGADEQKKKVVRQVAQRWIQVGVENYKKGLFEAAAQSFVRAQEYKGYLTAAELEKLNDLIEETHIALERKRILEHIQTAYKLIEQGELIKAKAHLENVKGSEFFTEAERKQITDSLSKLDNQLGGQAKEIADLYRSSVELYLAGQLEKALEGFVKVANSGLLIAPAGQTAEDYIRLIAVKMKPEAKPQKKMGPEAKPQKKSDKYSAYLPLSPKRTQRKMELEAKPQKKMEPEAEPQKKMGPEAEPQKPPEPEAIPQKPPELEAEPQKPPGPEAKPQKKMGPEAEPQKPPEPEAEPQKPPEPEAELQKPPELPVTFPEPKERAAVTGAVTDVEVSYIDKVTRRRNIRRSYTKTVVNDAVAKAQSYISQVEFDKAKRVVDKAKRTVSENQLDLGDLLFKQYDSQLKELTDEIELRESESAKQLELEKRQAAMEAARKRKEQTEADRQKRIVELMTNATACQQQQRYEEALGQLESLLALDPQNNNALILKQTLEDTVNLRKQLEVERERNRERAEILRKTDETAIPYAEELTYARNWRDIVAKPTRRPDEPIGLEEADMAVYKQLDEVVDLSALTPEMSFSDAIAELKNSVDPTLTIIVLWRDLLESADILQETTINMDGIPAIRLGTGLENLLKAVSGGLVDLDYVVENGVITVATIDSLPSKLITRVYDVTDLLGQPARGGGMMNMMMMGGGGGMYGGGGGQYGGGGGMYGGGGGMYGGGGGQYGGGGGMYGGGGGQYGGGGGMYGGGGQYGGGGGMYGGGMMGGGMMGGGMMGGGMMGGMGMDYDREYRADNLITLIQDTVEPDSWWEAGGEGTVTIYENKKLIVLQSREIHNNIEELLNNMRKSLGHQVSIETRFLVVTENFLEEIGVDLDFIYNLGGKFGLLFVDQGALGMVVPELTKVPGSLADSLGSDTYGTVGAGRLRGGYGSFLDDLQATFLIRASQAHTDATTLTAPKVTVLSGESATFELTRQISYALPPTVIGSGGGGGGYSPYGQTSGAGYAPSVIPNIQSISAGTNLIITPTISPDKKYVLLNITTYLRDLLRMKTHEVEAVVPGGGAAPTAPIRQRITVPETEFSSVQTRVSVPDGGTLLLGGQKITAEIEKEAGVPVLSKIPLIGRLFSNRTTVKDHKILLILVKPTIILQEEREKEAIAAMESKI